MALMIGTSGALRVMQKSASATTPEGLWRYRLDRERILIGGALSNGGNLARWLDATIQTGKKSALQKAVASLPADGHGLTVLPFLDGERSPNYRADARGTITGLRLSTTPPEVVRACFEAVSYRFGIIHDLLSPVVPDADEIVINGGAILNRPAWMQITADVLGRRLIASSEREATSRGAALVALQSLGALGSIDAAADRLGRSVEPNQRNHEVYRSAAARQAVLYQRLVEQPLIAVETAEQLSYVESEPTS